MDEDCLVPCPEEDCDGYLVQISLPSEPLKQECFVCGLVTWTTPEITIFTGYPPARVVRVEIFEDWNH